MKVAIIHEWLAGSGYSGAEKALEQMLNVFPQADLFCTVDFLDEQERSFLKGRKTNTSFIQKLPFAKKLYRHYLIFAPLAIEQFDLSEYDLIISSHHAVAKGVITGPDQLHISYIYSPVRYAWDMQHQYLKTAGIEKGIKSWFVRYVLHRIRIWDVRTANGVDHYIAISNFISKRVKKFYGRDSKVIYPPVDTEKFKYQEKKENYYLTASRLVPYKRIDLIVESFTKLPDKKLIVIGKGPELEKIQQLAKGHKNITVLGYQPDEVLQKHMQNAKAFIFMAKEDFGIIPLEAQACGTPVIAFGQGGVLETIMPVGLSDKPTGILFDEQNSSSLVEAINRFENCEYKIAPINCKKNALKYSIDTFKNNFQTYIELKFEEKI